MHAMRTGIGNISEESGGQLTLEVQVVLLEVAVLLHGIAGRREIVLGQGVLRDVWLRVAARDRRNDVCACRRNPTGISTLIERPGTEAGKSATADSRLIASVGIEGCCRGDSVVVAIEERRRGAVKNVVVRIGVERHVVRDEEDPITATNYGLRV